MNPSIDVRHATRSDIQDITNLFMNIFFTNKPRILRAVYRYLVRRDVSKRLAKENYYTHVGFLNDKMVSVFRAERRGVDYFVDSFLVHLGKEEKSNHFHRVFILSEWARYIYSKHKDTSKKVRLRFSSDYEKHIRGYSAVLKRLGFMTEISCPAQGSNNTFSLCFYKK